MSLLPLSFLSPPTYFSLPPSHIQGFSEMLKLAASISAPALVPEASEQETADESKTSLSNAHTHTLCVYTHAHTHLLFLFIPSYLHHQRSACTNMPAHNRHTNGETQTKHSRPAPSGCLRHAALPLLHPFLCKKVSLTSIFCILGGITEGKPDQAKYTFPTPSHGTFFQNQKEEENEENEEKWANAYACCGINACL